MKTIDTLLVDRTTGTNIMWATGTNAMNEIQPSDTSTIVPRVEKAKAEQKKRTKGKAEVFTPTWVVKKQNDHIDDEYKGLTLAEYVNKTWLEITCGEAPYMCSRYDTVTGEPLPIEKRVGFVDRKLRRISAEVHDATEWMTLAKQAYQSSYGYEYQGDSLFLARQNLLNTFADYYLDKFNASPGVSDVEAIASIISFNVFQMDGLKYTIPGMETKATLKDWNENEIITFENMTKQ